MADTNRYKSDFFRLPVYRAATRAYNTWKKASSHCAHHDQLYEVSPVKADLMNVLRGVTHIAVLGDDNAIKFIVDTLNVLEEVKLNLRALRDTGVISITAFRLTAEDVLNVRKQVENIAVKRFNMDPEKMPHNINIYDKEDREKLHHMKVKLTGKERRLLPVPCVNARNGECFSYSNASPRQSQQ